MISPLTDTSNKYKKKREFSNTAQPGYSEHLLILGKISAKTRFL